MSRWFLLPLPPLRMQPAFTALTSTFSHATLAHLGFNMIAFSSFGGSMTQVVHSLCCIDLAVPQTCLDISLRCTACNNAHIPMLHEQQMAWQQCQQCKLAVSCRYLGQSNFWPFFYRQEWHPPWPATLAACTASRAATAWALLELCMPALLLWQCCTLVHVLLSALCLVCSPAPHAIHWCALVLAASLQYCQCRP
jgi:hypothetical protein